METYEAITTRRSIRRFKNIPVEWYLVGKVIHAGTQAPTAGNLQDFRFMVISNPDLKKAVAHAALDQLWIASAPIVIIVFSEYVKCKRFYGIRGERLYTIQDCAAAMQNMLLAAHDLGLGACWIGAFDEDALNTAIGIPEYARPQAILAIGYPDEVPTTPAKYKLENFVFFNKWQDNSGKIEDIPSEIFKDWAPKVEKTIKGTIGAVQKGGQFIGDSITNKAKELGGKLKKSLSKK